MGLIGLVVFFNQSFPVTEIQKKYVFTYLGYHMHVNCKES